jgi:hypothetical protein
VLASRSTHCEHGAVHNSTRPRIALALFAAYSLLIPGARAAGAQDNRAYLGVSALISKQNPVDPGSGSSVAKPGLGGTTAGVSGEVGGFWTRALSLAFEFSLPARFHAVQFTGIPNSRVESDHRDIIFSGLFHLHTPPAGIVRFAAVAGPSVIREDTLSRSAFAPFGSTNYGTPGPQSAFARWTVGLTFGADVAFAAGPHVEVVPAFRLHHIERAKLGDRSGIAGLSPWVVRPAIGIRAVF